MAPAPEPALDLRRALEARVGSWAARVEHHDTLGSTNDRLRSLAVAGAPEWTVVSASRQTQGRGRLGRRWISPPGNLHLSVLLRPPRGTELGILPLAAGLVVAEAVRARGAPAQVKWPNDVLVGDRKLAGVLAEAQSAGGAVEWVCLGIGVNLAAAAVEFGALAASRVSLAELVQQPPAPAELAADVLVRLREAVRELVSGQVAPLLGRWRALSVAWWGEPVEVEQGATTLRGRARDVDEDGALRLELADGRVERVVSGDARRLRPLPAAAD